MPHAGIFRRGFGSDDPHPSGWPGIRAAEALRISGTSSGNNTTLESRAANLIVTNRYTLIYKYRMARYLGLLRADGRQRGVGLLRVVEEKLIAVGIIDHQQPVAPRAFLDLYALGFEFRAQRVQRGDLRLRFDV